MPAQNHRRPFPRLQFVETFLQLNTLTLGGVAVGLLSLYREALMELFRTRSAPVPQSPPPSGGVLAMARSSLSHWLILVGFAGVLGALAGIYGVTGAYMANHPNTSDFFKFYLSSVRVRFGQSAYWPAPEMGEIDRLCGRPTPLKPLGDPPADPEPALADVHPCSHPNLNPPVFSAVTWPLGYFHPTVAWWLWSALSLACFGLALKNIWDAGIFPLKVWYAPALWVAGSFAYLPVFVNFWSGQLGFMIFLPVTLCWLALRQGNDFTGGAWLGLAASVKPFLGLVLVILVLNKNWRACLACLMILILAFLLGGTVLGFGAYQEYIQVLGHIYWHSASGNASLQGFFTRVFGGSEATPWVALPGLGKVLTITCSAFVLAAVIRVTRQIHEAVLSRVEQTDALFAIVLPGMLLISPLAWVYYLPLLILSAIIALNVNSPMLANRVSALIIIGSACINGVPSFYFLPREPNAYRMWFWNGSHVFYGLLAFFGVVVLVITKFNRHRVAMPDNQGGNF